MFQKRIKSLFVLLSLIVVLLLVNVRYSAASPTVQTGGTVRFAAVGDYGNNSANETAVANLINNTLNPDFVITTGDNRYGNTTFDTVVGKFFCDSLKGAGSGTNCAGNLAPVNAFFPSLGNHDYTDGGGINEYQNYFTLPGSDFTNTSGNERYYDFVKGPVHFFVVNSNSEEPNGRASNSTQGQWLQTQLAASTSAWNLVYMHHPPYTSTSTHSSETIMQWPFEAWGADAVLAGHNHFFERIVKDSNGDGVAFPYFITGAGGQSLYNFTANEPDSQARYNANYGTMLVQATDTSITFEFWSVANGGTLVDSYVMPPAAPAAQALPIVEGDVWRYFKGIAAPGSGWNTVGFDDSSWLTGTSGFGYGDTDDNTVLADMLNSYLTVFARKEFSVVNPGSITNLILSMDYDDGFVAYLNGTEIARDNVTGSPPAYNTIADGNHEASGGDAGSNPSPVETFNIPPGLLVAGDNVLAVQGHNVSLASSDFSLIPTLATTQTVTFQQGTDGYTGAVDTFIRELAANANTNYSASTVLEWDDNTDEVTLVRFTNIFSSEGGPIPNSATIVSASLRYMTTNLTGGSTANGDPANVYESLVNWPVTTVTWNNFGGEAGVQADEYEDLIASAPATALSTAYTINTTASLQQWAANPTSNLGWIFLPTAADGVTLYSSEAATTANRPLLTVTYTTTPESSTGWIAYNDLNNYNGGNAANVTTHGYAAANATLKNYVTGADLPVSISVVSTGAGTFNDGANFTTTTSDAYLAFNSIVNMQGVYQLDAIGDASTITFNGLDPVEKYAITLSVNRANAPYINMRYSKVTIQGADSYVNTSSTGVVVNSPDSVSFSGGYNTVNGYVAKWTGITAADGSFSVRTVWDSALGSGANNTKGYAMSAFKLEQVAAVSQIWDGGGADNNWSTAANWVGDVAPTAANIVRFDATSSKPATANIPAVAGIVIDDGYTGSIDFSSPLAVSGHYRQESGTVIVNPALAFTVNGRFSHNGGTLQETRSVPGGTVNFLKIQTSGGTDVYRGVDLAPSVSLGSATVSVKAVDLVTEFCTSTGGGSPAYAGRCFNITPTSNGAATVTLWAPTSAVPASPRVYHYTGAWQVLTTPLSGVVGSYTWVSGNTTGFSPFLIGGATGPTAVSLQSFTAQTGGGGWLVIVGLLLAITAGILFIYKFEHQKKSVR